MGPNLARELLQARLLGALFRDNMRSGLSLKGGMAMRVAYGSVRYTKDIDVAADASLATPERVKALIGAAIATTLRASSFLKGGHASLCKDTDTTLRWKIEGMIGATRVNLTVEVSRRDRLPGAALEQTTWTPPPETGIGPITLDVFSMQMMAVSKIDCMCNPNREAPRDLWDLEILARLGVEPDPALVARIGRARLQAGLLNLWNKVEKMDYATACSQLEPFLDEDARSRFNEDTWDHIRLSAFDKTQTWIRQALALEVAGMADVVAAAGLQDAAFGAQARGAGGAG